MPFFESFFAHSRSLFQPISILIYLALYVRIDFILLLLGKLFNIFDVPPTDDFWELSVLVVFNW